MTTYNALDCKKLAEELRHQLVLEKADLDSSLDYDFHTSWCDNCPDNEYRREFYDTDDFPPYVPDTCCKDDGSWDEQNRSAYEHMQHIETLLKAISSYMAEK